jgi:Domain of unknown function (DUF4249)
MRTALLTTLVVATACGLRDVTGPPGKEQVVVQCILHTQRAEQELWIERSTPAGEPISFGPLPLQPPPSRVEVRDTAGNVFTFAVDTTEPRRFTATFTPLPGARYDLLIEAGGRTVRASAVVPRAIAIVDPAPDTVSAAANSLLSVAWTGPNRWVRVAMSDSADREIGLPLKWIMNDTATQVMMYSPYRRLVVWVLAVDSVTARVADPFSFQNDFAPYGQLLGNITGGVGFFGAATSDRVVVNVQ